MSRPLKVRDIRNKGWFFIDNKFIDVYGKHLGCIGIAIYIVLCRHANGEQVCFPSQIYIGKKINVDQRTVRRYLKKFVDFNIIHVAKEKKRGKWLNNLYTLLDKDVWMKPEDTMSSRNHRTLKTSLEDFEDRNQRAPRPTNNTNRKDTNIRKERRIKNQEERIKPIKRKIETLMTSFKV